jgi:hypothetical protein
MGFTFYKSLHSLREYNQRTPKQDMSREMPWSNGQQLSRGDRLNHYLIGLLVEQGHDINNKYCEIDECMLHQFLFAAQI